MNPANQELALALKTMSERVDMSLGDALVLRFAAERLREDLADPEPEVEDEGWVEWNPSMGKPDLPDNTVIEWFDRDGDLNTPGKVGNFRWKDYGGASVAKYRVLR